MGDEVAAGGPTFDELLEYLDDLIQLAANERYLFLATALEVVLRVLREQAAAFSERADVPPTPADGPLRRST